MCVCHRHVWRSEDSLYSWFSPSTCGSWGSNWCCQGSLLSNILLPPNSFLKEETLQETKLQKLTSFFYLKTAGGINKHTHKGTETTQTSDDFSWFSLWSVCSNTECDYITHRWGQSGVAIITWLNIQVERKIPWCTAGSTIANCTVTSHPLVHVHRINSRDAGIWKLELYRHFHHSTHPKHPIWVLVIKLSLALWQHSLK